MDLYQYCRVKLVTDKYTTEGVRKGTIGYIIEVYGKESFEYEVEFSDSSTGETIAQVVVTEEDIEIAEKLRQRD